MFKFWQVIVFYTFSNKTICFLRMYKREEEVDGMVVDPLKALHQVKRTSTWNFSIK